MSRQEPDPIGDIEKRAAMPRIPMFPQIIAFLIFAIVTVTLAAVLIMVVKWAMNIW